MIKVLPLDFLGFFLKKKNIRPDIRSGSGKIGYPVSGRISGTESGYPVPV